MPDPNFSRVAVLGCSGSGKSTLAANLATKLGLPFFPTDDIYWQADWTPTPAAEVEAWLEATTSAPRWVLDGNFDAQRNLLWGRAELAVWLDLPWLTTVSAVLFRNLGWWISGERVWGGQRMTLAKLISGVRHAAKGHGAKRKTYPDLLGTFPNLTVVRIRSRRQLDRWAAEPRP